MFDSSNIGLHALERAFLDPIVCRLLLYKCRFHLLVVDKFGHASEKPIWQRQALKAQRGCAWGVRELPRLQYCAASALVPQTHSLS